MTAPPTPQPTLDPETGDEIITVREFAVRQGYRANYGHELAKTGRLVMAPDGKRCLYRASLERFDASKDPSKQGVAARHAATREQHTPAHPGAEREEGAAEGGDAPGGPDKGTTYDYQISKAKREHWAAEREHASFRKEAGELMERSEVVAAFADVGATMRSRLESWASVLPPQLAGQDEAAVRATIAAQVELLLRDLADKFKRLAAESANA